MTASGAAQLLERLDDPAVRDQVAEIPDLDTLLADQLADGRATWPTVAVPDAVYLDRIAAILRERPGEPAERVLRTLPAADVYLAIACTAGDDRAIVAFRTALIPGVRDVLARLGAPAATIDETEQRVLEMLFVAGDRDRAQIATYTGRGRLRSWVRSIGVRTGRRLLGVDHGRDDDNELERLPAAVDDPRLELLRTEYSGEFRAAFTTAFAGLTERQRNLLRQYHIDELTIDQLAGLYQVNRATAARWVIAARGVLLDATRANLAAALAIDPGEVDSIIRLVRSRIDVSIRELFG